MLIRLSVCCAAVLLALGLASVARAGDTICFEAAATTNVVAPMKIVKATPGSPDEKVLREACNQRALDIPEGVGKPPDVGGEAVFRFNVKESGSYWLWARVWWDDGCGNSFTVVLDNKKPYAFGDDATYKSWHWVKGLKDPLTPGVHVLRIQNREDGIKVDQILFTQDGQYVPVGVEDVTPGALVDEGAAAAKP